MTKFNIGQEERLKEYQIKEADNEKRDAELRKMIREHKAQHRELSMKSRYDDIEDRRLFTKFADAHDDKLILKKAIRQSEFSPKSSA